MKKSLVLSLVLILLFTAVFPTSLLDSYNAYASTESGDTIPIESIQEEGTITEATETEETVETEATEIEEEAPEENQPSIMAQGNSHVSNKNVYLWNNGPVSGVSFQASNEWDGDSPGNNGGTWQQYGNLELWANPKSNGWYNNTITVHYTTSNVDLTGVLNVGVKWENTGSNNDENHSKLAVLNSSQIKKTRSFGLRSDSIDVKSLKDEHDIRVTARGKYFGFDSDKYNSHLYVKQLWLEMQQYTINVSSGSGGYVDGLGGTYNYGEMVYLNAVPNVGYEFEKWVIDGSNNYNKTLDIFVDGNKNIKAYFKPKMITVTTEMMGPEGSGTFTAGGTYPYGTQITLKATPNEGFGFDKWTSTIGGYESVNPEWSFSVPPNDITITGYFDRSYNITTGVSPEVGGWVSGAGAYLENRPVVLQAIPDEANGYEFVSWTEAGEVVSTDPQYAFDATVDRSLLANFRLRTETITVTAFPSWGGTVDGEGDYEFGQMVTATAVPREDYQFVHWSIEGNPVSKNPVYTFEAVSSPQLVANFRLKPGTFSAQPYSQFTGERISFDASMIFLSFDEGYSYSWDFGDGTSAMGSEVDHVYQHEGDYEVRLRVFDTDGIQTLDRTRSIRIRQLLALEESRLIAYPQGITRAKAGEMVSWEVFFENNGIPLANREIQVSDEILNNLSTITTDDEGRAFYQMMIPNGYPEYSLKIVTFYYEGLKITRGIQIYDNNIKVGGKVFDHYTGKPLTNVAISIEAKTVKTDSQGNYEITGLTSGIATVSAVIMNYQTRSEEILLNRTSVIKNISLTRYIPSTEPVIGRIYSEFTDSSSGKDHFFSPIQDKNLTFKVEIDWRGHEPGEIHFITPQGSSIVDASIGEKTFNIGLFNPGDRMQVKAITAHSTESNLVDAGFEITQPPPINPNTDTISEDDAKTEPVGGNIPFIGGSIMRLNLGKIPIRVILDEENGKITADIGWKIYDRSSGPYDGNIDKMKKLWKKMKDDRNLGQAVTKKSLASKDVIVGGRMVFTYDNEKKTWLKKEGYIVAIAIGEVGYTVHYFTPVGIPVYGQIKAGGILDARIGLAWNYEHEELQFKGVISPKVYVRLAIGAGICDTLAVEGWGRALGNMDISYIPHVDILDKYIQFSMGYKITLLAFSYEQFLWNQRWPEATPKMMSIPEVGELKPLSRDYLEGESVWMPSTFSTFSEMADPHRNVEETTMQSNVFPNTEPKIILTDSGKMMVWAADDESRSAMNRTSIVYSNFDGEEWSPPVPIENDGTADFYPEIAKVSGGVVAAWVDNASRVAEDVSVADYLKEGEISVAFYDEEKKGWLKKQSLTNDCVRQGSPKVAASDDIAMVVWTENATDEYPEDESLNNVLYSQPDDIMFALWNGTDWSQPEVVAPQVGVVVTSSLSYDGSKAVYAYSLDMDSDIATTEDQEIYIVEYDEDSGWGSPVRMTNNAVQDTNSQLNPYNPSNLFWYQEGKIVYIDEFDQVEARVVVEGEDTAAMADFSLATRENGARSVVWAEGIGEAQEFYTSVYDQTYDQWSGKVQLTNNGAINRTIDTALDEEGNILAVYGKRSVEVDEEKEQIISDQTDLTYAKMIVGKDVSIKAEDIVFSEENPMPGSSVTVEATIWNQGELAVKDLEVAFYDGDPADRGTQIGETQIISEVINAGGDGIATVEWNIPEGFSSKEVYVVVDPKHKIIDRNRDNNTDKIKVFQPDLEVVSLDWEPMGTENYLVTARVSNRGYLTASNVTLKVLKENMDGEVIDIKNISSLAPGEEREEMFILNLKDADFDNGMIDIVVIAETQDQNTLMMNNIESILVRQPRPFSGGIVTALDLNKNNVVLSIGEEETLVELFTPIDATNRGVSWSTSDPTIATVNNGVVTALGVGEAVITATSDDGGFTAIANVQVLTPPVIELMGSSRVYLTMGDTYQEEGVIATEVLEGDLNEAVEIGGDLVDTSTPGIYTVKYNVTGAGGNSAEEVIRTVVVLPPPTTIAGSTGGARTLAVTDALPNATLKLMDTNHNLVDTTTLAGLTTTYTFTSVPAADGYYVLQAVNGVESEASNIVDVGADITPPEITLVGEATINLLMGDDYIDDGAFATDELDGDITFRIVTTGLPDTDLPGIYSIRYNISDLAGNPAQEITRTVNVAPTPVNISPGDGSVWVDGAIPGGTLTLYDNLDRVRATGTANLYGEYRFTNVSSGNGYYVIQTDNGSASVPSNLINVTNIFKSFMYLKIVTMDDGLINYSLSYSQDAIIDIAGRFKPVAEISGGVIKALSQNKTSLVVVGRGVELVFAPTTLAIEKEQVIIEIAAKEVAGNEKETIMKKVALGETIGLYDIGSSVFDFTIQLKQGESIKELNHFSEPVVVTFDLSHLGDLSKEEIASLTGIRLEKDDQGNIHPVKLGGTYDPEKKQFSFYTDQFSIYSVMKADDIVNINLTINHDVVLMNGVEREVDVAPIITNNRTMVPLRMISEGFGAEVNWEAETRTVVINLDGKEIRLTVGESSEELDVPPMIINNRTMVPLRYISEKLGANVIWIPSSKSIVIAR